MCTYLIKGSAFFYSFLLYSSLWMEKNKLWGKTHVCVYMCTRVCINVCIYTCVYSLFSTPMAYVRMCKINCIKQTHTCIYIH